MKKLALISVAAATVSSVSMAQTALHDLVAGWDFSQYVSGVSSVDGASFTSTLDANYSESARGSAASGFGTIYYDGSFGSSNLNINPGPGVQLVPTGPSLVSNLNYDDFGEVFDQVGLDSTFEEDLKLVLGENANTSLVFEVAGGYTDYIFNFAGSMNANTNTLSFSVSSDGTSYTPVATTAELTTADTKFTVDFTSNGVINGASDVFIKMDFSNIAQGSEVFIDNVAVLGVIPEPSMSLALMGFVAAMFTVVRRRR
jgi:hypothetical protein